MGPRTAKIDAGTPSNAPGIIKIAENLIVFEID